MAVRLTLHENLWQRVRLKQLRNADDSKGLMLALRSCLVRDYCGIDSYRLHASYLVRQKALIEAFLNEVLKIRYGPFSVLFCDSLLTFVLLLFSTLADGIID